jgi:hypothetical protein
MRPREHLEEIDRQLKGLCEVVVCIFQQLAPEEPLPWRLGDYIAALKHAPALVEWWKRSACH